MEALYKELQQLDKASLSKALVDVDKMIEQLCAARDQVAGAADPHTASLTLTKLQNPIKEGFEAVLDDLKTVNKGLKDYGKVLGQAFPTQPLPTDYDAMADHGDLINRAIVMHLLREGQFRVAATFLDEAKYDLPGLLGAPEAVKQARARDQTPSDAASNHHYNHHHNQHHSPAPVADPWAHAIPSSEQAVAMMRAAEVGEQTYESRQLQLQFVTMYELLHELRRKRNLLPAIGWAQQNSAALEARGSNLEFELERLQFVWLFKGTVTDPDDEQQREEDDDDSFFQGQAAAPPDDSDEGRAARTAAALAYARRHFARFQGRHLREVRRLVAGLVYAENLPASPYAADFQTGPAFREAALTFTRDFCSLLGLSAESPLYVAATAGAIALPRVSKYLAATKDRRTEWTTAQELAFETPLPRSMVYHPIFVCPVSKEQTTATNPPAMLPCGHVVARESLQRLIKNNKFKCPYCPQEGHATQVREIVL